MSLACLKSLLRRVVRGLGLPGRACAIEKTAGALRGIRSIIDHSFVDARRIPLSANASKSVDATQHAATWIRHNLGKGVFPGLTLVRVEAEVVVLTSSSASRPARLRSRGFEASRPITTKHKAGSHFLLHPPDFIRCVPWPLQDSRKMTASTNGPAQSSERVT